MLYYNFKNYEEFKTIFGVTKHGNGTKSRKNKILLAYLKNPKLLRQARESGNYSLLHISSMGELKQKMMEQIIESGDDDLTLPHTVKILNYNFSSATYRTDEYEGICEDRDYRAVRYINTTNDRVFKMRSGKMLRNLILETEFGQQLSPQVINYLCEEFALEWQVFSMKTMPEVTLYVNEDFERIYSSSECRGKRRREMGEVCVTVQ